MNLLLLAFRFAPYNSAGAVRLTQTAKYLLRMGHEVRVLTAAPQALAPTLESEVPAEAVEAAPWLDVNAPVDRLLGGRTAVARQGYADRGRSLGRIGPRLGLWYKTLFHLPDRAVGWYPYALRAARRLVSARQPDLIYASLQPATALFVAARLSKETGVPWVAEFRDLWSDPDWCPYLYHPFRRALDRALERRVVRSASGIVTVSQPLAAILETRHNKPTAVVRNAYDSDRIPPTPPAPAAPSQELLLVHTGRVRYGKRDASGLFDALARLKAAGLPVRVRFFGPGLAPLRELADRYGVGDRVDLAGSVTHEEALQAQSRADVLLLLLANSPGERGVYTGKLFEYLAARRPVLVVGYDRGVAADLVRERRAGAVAVDADAIARALQAWIREKRAHGTLPPLPASVAEGLSRADQTKRLAAFLQSLLG